MDPGSEPAPLDPTCRRWLPDLALPDHRFLPGTTARHPVALTAGMPVERGAPVAANWRDSRRYLAGVDHFNFAYWWEAHEFWEEFSRCSFQTTKSVSGYKVIYWVNCERSREVGL